MSISTKDVHAAFIKHMLGKITKDEFNRIYNDFIDLYKLFSDMKGKTKLGSVQKNFMNM